MNSLPAWAKTKKLIVSPFGSPEPPNIRVFGNKNFEKPLRILFVGSMGQRKGLGDLFTAMKMLKNENVELVVLGSLLAPMEFYKSELPNFIYEPCRPHSEVLKLMQTCDIFCLPSIVEGRALVMQEAMSQGLPLIITPNTGGEDLIIENETGFLIPIRRPEAIAEKIMWFVNNRSSAEEMGYKARCWAENYTWKKYSEKIVKEILVYLGAVENNYMQERK
nr:glycosyltransferase family 4 protein [Antarcticibacterium sp. W02-3]